MKTKKLGRKTLSLLLALLMVITAVPLTVLPASAASATIGVYSYNTLNSENRKTGSEDYSQAAYAYNDGSDGNTGIASLRFEISNISAAVQSATLKIKGKVPASSNPNAEIAVLVSTQKGWNPSDIDTRSTKYYDEIIGSDYTGSAVYDRVKSYYNAIEIDRFKFDGFNSSNYTEKEIDITAAIKQSQALGNTIIRVIFVHTQSYVGSNEGGWSDFIVSKDASITWSDGSADNGVGVDALSAINESLLNTDVTTTYGSFKIDNETENASWNTESNRNQVYRNVLWAETVDTTGYDTGTADWSALASAHTMGYSATQDIVAQYTWMNPTTVFLYDEDDNGYKRPMSTSTMFYANSWMNGSIGGWNYDNRVYSSFLSTASGADSSPDVELVGPWHGCDSRPAYLYTYFDKGEVVYGYRAATNSSAYESLGGTVYNMVGTVDGQGDVEWLANIISVKATMEDDEFSKELTVYYGADHNLNGDKSKFYTSRATSKDKLYMVNYVPLKKALEEAIEKYNAYKDDLAKNPGKYVETSVEEFVAAVDALIKAKPNNFDYSNGTEAQVANYASAASAAVAMWEDAKDLEVQSYAITFNDANGVQLDKKYYEYGTIPTAPAFPYISNTEGQHSKTSQWDKTVSKVTGATTYKQVVTSWEEHAVNSWTTVKKVTCTENGREEGTCTLCNATASRAIVTTGHDYITTVTGATCDAAGYTVVTCSKCDYNSGQINSVNKLEHEFTNYVTTSPATCTSKEEQTATCAHGCGATDVRYVGSVLEHDHESTVWTQTVPPTCTTVGKETNKCATCDDIVTRDIPATGHDFDTDDAPISASADEMGGHYYLCENGCGAKGIYEDEKHKENNTFVHTWNKGTIEKPATCEATGIVKYSCTACSQVRTATIPTVSHSMTEVEYKAPTCKEKGNKTYYTCSLCNKAYKDANGQTLTTADAEEIAALNHPDYAKVAGEKVNIDATCTTNAKNFAICTLCGLELTESIEVPDTATGHNYIYPEGQAVVYQKVSDIHHQIKCTECDVYSAKTPCTFNVRYENITEGEYADVKHKAYCACGNDASLDHTYGDWITDENGASRKCSLCDYVETTECVFDDTKETRVSASCTDEGYVIKVCTVQGHNHTEEELTYVIPLTGHNFEIKEDKSNIIVKNDGTHAVSCQNKGCTQESPAETCSGGKATCTEKAVCAVCGAAYGNKLDHAYGAYSVTTKANCRDKEVRKATCTRTGCDDVSIIEGTTNPDVHVELVNVTGTPAKCETAGNSDYKECSYCKVTIGKQDYPATGHDFTFNSAARASNIVKNGDGTHSFLCRNGCGEYGAVISVIDENDNVTSVQTKFADGGYVACDGIATCKTKAKCTVCGVAHGVVDPDKHETTNTYVYGATAATCTVKGYTGDTRHTCCDAIVKDAEGNEIGKGTDIETIEHNMTEVDVRVESTCEVKGSVTYKCADCGSKTNKAGEEVKEALPLNYGNHETNDEGIIETVLIGAKAATCTVEGYTGDLYCKECYIEGATDAVNAKALITKGKKIKANNKHRLSDPIPEYKIASKDEETGTITLKGGAVAYEDMIAARRADGRWYHVQVCLDCNEFIEGSCYTYEHTYGCDTTDICEVCEGLCSLKDTTKHDADLYSHTGSAATCIESGVKTYYECETCNKFFFDAAGKNIIPGSKEDEIKDGSAEAVEAAKKQGGALYIGIIAHSYDWANGVVLPGNEADCGNMGTTTYYCKNASKGCDAKYELQNISSEGMHVWSDEDDDAENDIKEMKPATCTTNAYEAKYCVKCDKVKAGTYVAVPDTALGHDIPEEAMDVVTPATCTQDGVKKGVCTREIDGEICGEEATAAIPAFGHTWSEFEVDENNPGDCMNGKNEKRTCSTCNVTETRVVPSDDHEYIVQVIVEATCKNDGYKTIICKYCGIGETEIISNEGIECQFDMTTWKVTDEATCDKGEMRRYTCKICGNTKTEEFTGEGTGSALGHVWLEQLPEVPRCEADGWTAHYRCVRCLKIDMTETGEWKYEIIPAIGHSDENGDHKCDNCSAYLDGYQEEIVCGCMCHSDNFIMKFIYKIACVFWKLFKINSSCSCGMVHY